MKNLFTLLSLVSLVTLSACSSSTEVTTDDAAGTQETGAVYSMNEAAAAGEFVHTITFAEKLDTIPASSTIADFEIIAEDLPAAEGFTWVHLKGTVTNNSGASESLDSTNVAVVDSEGNQYSVSTDTTIYIEDGKSPVYIDIQPTQTIDWEGYFMVPSTATGLQFYGNDLSFLPEAEVFVNLGL